jgi:hypothetical protein
MTALNANIAGEPGFPGSKQFDLVDLGEGAERRLGQKEDKRERSRAGRDYTPL